MANKSMTSQLIVQLIDQVSAPARAIGRSILGINDAMRSTNGAPVGFSARLDEAIARNNAALDEARGRLFDAAAGFFVLKTALTAPITSAMEQEAALSGIASKAGLSADEITRLAAAAREAGQTVNQSTADMLKSVDYLVGMGLSSADAQTAMADIGKAATATKADILELSQAGYAAMANLKVPADQVATALDFMAQAGKRGGFELKDMAQYFPQVGAAYQALGQSGTSSVADLAAAMQVMRMDTGDASTAATNLQNVLQKVFAPATVKKFGDKGIDIFAEMEKAAQRGLTPIEAIAEITNTALDGDLSKIGFLFEDAQAQAGVRSMIQHMETFREIRAQAMAGAGTNQEDFNRAMQTTEQRVKRARIAMQNMGTAIGSALLPVILALEQAITPVMTAFADFADKHPSIVAGIVAITAGFVALRVAAAALSFVGLMGRGGVLSALALGMNTVGKAAGALRAGAASMIAYQGALKLMAGAGSLTTFERIASGLRGMILAVPGISALGTGLAAIGTAIGTISAPVWGIFAAIAAAVAAAGYTIWKYWDRISAIMSGVGQAIGEILSPALEAIRPILDWFAPLGDMIASGWKAAGDAISAAGDWLGSFFQKEVLTEDQKADAKKAGYDFVMAIWNGMKQVAAEMIAWIVGIGEKMVAPIKKAVDTIKSYLPSGDANAAAAAGLDSTDGVNISGAHAKGGPMSRGKTYLVGEEGPELVTASRSGYVNPTHKSFGGGGPTINLGGMTVVAAPGQSPEQIAEAVWQKIKAKTEEAFRGIQADSGLEVY